MSHHIVLLFHSVDDRDLMSFKDLGNVRPEIFEKLLITLKKDFDIVRLEDIIESVSNEAKRQGRLLAITFDDGPKSYSTNVVPVMESLDMPSKCFLITDCVGDKEVYWRYLYNFCVNSGCGNELAGLINEEYKVFISEDEIISFTRSNYNKEKNKNVVKNIFDRIVSEEEYRRSERNLFLSYEDIETLKKNPLVSFGIHTCTHPVMMGLSNEEIYDEISASLDFYKSRIKDNIPAFSIPFGRLYRDYDERTINIAHSLSIKTILSAYGGSNYTGQPAYNIRRVPVNEEMLKNGPDSFIEMLKGISVPPEYIEKERRLDEAISNSPL